MSITLDELDTQLDRLVADDPELLSDAELHDLVVRLQRQRHRMASVAAKAIGVWDQRMSWASDGSRSAGSRLAAETAVSPTTANAEVRMARRLRSMPHTAAALANGDVSPDHVGLLAKANRPWRDASFAEHEALLVDQCCTLRFRQAQQAVQYWCQLADAEASEDDAERLREGSHLDMASTLDGVIVMRGELDPISGAIVSAEVDRIERELRADDERDGIVRSASQRRAAALVEMATRSATAPANGRRPKPLFTALVGADRLEGLCELSTGAVVTPGQLARWAEVADIESVLFDGPSTVISVSHRRTFTGALRRAIEVRDRSCRHPSGCDVHADRCDGDHIVPHAQHGPTSQFNGRLLCSTHNRHSDRRDHDAEPLPARSVDRLDELRCRLRWKFLREDVDHIPDDVPDDLPEAVSPG